MEDNQVIEDNHLRNCKPANRFLNVFKQVKMLVRTKYGLLSLLTPYESSVFAKENLNRND